MASSCQVSQMARRLKDGKYPIHFTKISAASRRKDCCVITPSTKYPTIRKVLDLFWFSYILWYSYIVVIFPGLLWNKVLIASQRDSLQSWDDWELKRASNDDFFAIPAYLVCLGFFLIYQWKIVQGIFFLIHSWTISSSVLLQSASTKW